MPSLPTSTWGSESKSRLGGIGDALVPKDYAFAMITDQIHFIKFPNVMQDYITGQTTCGADGMGRLIMDDKGQPWHDWIWQYVAPNVGVSEGVWLGIDDSQLEGTWIWNDGTQLSASVKTMWYGGEPGGGAPDDCIILWKPYGGMWGDYTCHFKEWILCEVRFP
ncbi:unnamed protein product [Darwinula stevensoni]|uniref:C-type lectin domain-containing protein n=1 Tax=Darwinula stevensoni TaxID=69355 RepID=A0A7R9ADM7_9CRUS|nr:unnamed protein product [Darwinula stevensoni]CAG0901241.1 unnamed protein product [Darwinula stevensoni]